MPPEPGAFAPMTASPTIAVSRDAVRRDSARDMRRAEAVLARLAATYRHLEGVSVEMGMTPNGEQAVA